MPRGVRASAALAGVAIAIVLLTASAARAERTWTMGLRGALPTEGPTETVHRGFDGGLFVERQSPDPEFSYGLEAAWLRDPGGKTTPHDEFTLFYGGPRVNFRVASSVVPAYIQLGALGGSYDRNTQGTPSHDASGGVFGGFVGALVRYDVRPHVGVQFDGRFARMHGPNLPKGEDNVDFWSVGFAVLTWK